MNDLSSQLLLGTVGVLAVSTPALANQVATSTVSQQTIEALNMASLTSIESSWLKVEPVCKARSFHADATHLILKEAKSAVQALYASFEA